MKFRKFLKSDKTNIFERRHYMLGSSIAHDRFPIPLSVINVLNAIENPTTQQQLLIWIFTEGMREALVNRRTVSDFLTQQSGIEIPQDAVFSRRAMEEIPGFAEAYKKYNIEERWMLGFEPDYAVLSGDNMDKSKSKITKKLQYLSMKSINAALMKQGKAPFYFGGPDGLLEYIEKGDWREHSLHTDPRYDKKGINLSLDKGSSGLRKDPNTGESTYCFGLNMGGAENNTSCSYQPSTNSNYWNDALKSSKKESLITLKRIAKNIKSGIELSDEEKSLVNQYLKNGEMSKKYSLLKNVIMVLDRSIKGVQKAGGTDEDWIHAKAAVKANLLWQLSFPPEINPKTGKPNPPGVKTNYALGHSTSGRFPNAVIKTRNGEIDLTQPEWRNLNDDPQLREKVADMIIADIFDDETRTISKRLEWVRGVRTNIPNQEYRPNRTISNMLATNRGSEKAISSNDAPVKVNFQGKEMAFDRSELFQKMKKSEMSVLVHPNITVKTLIPTSGQPLNINAEEANQWRTPNGLTIDKISKDELMATIQIPGTKVSKNIMRKSPEDPWMEVVPENSFVNVEELESQGYQKQAIDEKHKNILRLYNPEIKDEVILHRVITNVNGESQKAWKHVPPVVKSKLENPIIGGLFATVNTAKGQKTIITHHDKAKASQEWDYFMSHLEEYGDKAATGKGVPANIPLSGWLGATVVANLNKDKPGRETDPNKFISSGLMALKDKIASPYFRYGTLNDKNQTTIFTLLAKKGLSPEEINEIIPIIKKVLFIERQKLEYHNGPELFIAPGKFRKDIYEAILANGFQWRIRQSNNAVKSNEELFGDIAKGEAPTGNDDDYVRDQAERAKDEEDEESDEDDEDTYEDDWGAENRFARADDEGGDRDNFDDELEDDDEEENDEELEYDPVQDGVIGNKNDDDSNRVADDYEKQRQGQKRNDLSQAQVLNLQSLGGNQGLSPNSIFGDKLDSFAGGTLNRPEPEQIKSPRVRKAGSIRQYIRKAGSIRQYITPQAPQAPQTNAGSQRVRQAGSIRQYPKGQ